jgi:hypothetical protein
MDEHDLADDQMAEAIISLDKLSHIGCPFNKNRGTNR